MSFSDMTHRIGTFFMLVGLLLIGLFLLSDMAETPTCGFMISGSFFFAIGVFLWFRDPAPPPQETGRFRILRSSGKKRDRAE
jgi:hypothetical protein